MQDVAPRGRDSPGQARKEGRVSPRSCGRPGRQQQWRTQAALAHVKSQFIFSSEIRWEETVTRGRNSSEPGWGGGGTHFLIRALFMDVWVWLAFVHTGTFARVPQRKNADSAIPKARRGPGAVPGAVPGQVPGVRTVQPRGTALSGCSHGELGLPPGPLLRTADMLLESG